MSWPLRSHTRERGLEFTFLVVMDRNLNHMVKTFDQLAAAAAFEPVDVLDSTCGQKVAMRSTPPLLLERRFCFDSRSQRLKARVIPTLPF